MNKSLLLATLVAAVALAACGKKADAPASTPTPAATPAPATTEAASAPMGATPSASAASQ